jgi:hypothetical protein
MIGRTSSDGEWRSGSHRPSTNLFVIQVLPSLDLVPDVKKKEDIAAFLRGEDIISRYRGLGGESDYLRVSIKSPLNTWSMPLPRNMKLLDLWELSFRLAKGRYLRFDLQHRNSRLPVTQATISSTIDVNHAVFIAPLGSIPRVTGKNVSDELCLVKIHDARYRLVTSYWEPKNTTRSFASAVFRYYRAKFVSMSTTPVEQIGVF